MGTHTTTRLAVLCILAAGCAGGAEESVKAAQRYAQSACACTDAACAAESSAAYAATLPAPGTAAQARADEARAISAATMQATDCVTRMALAKIPH